MRLRIQGRVKENRQAGSVKQSTDMKQGEHRWLITENSFSGGFGKSWQYQGLKAER